MALKDLHIIVKQFARGIGQPEPTTLRVIGSVMEVHHTVFFCISKNNIKDGPYS